ncbi:hypothetical protein M3Y97_00104400 [Aphelenchoides bicaudatus]|nr:hypothetical protein M3Y97_00104400 [Aphelenchoides bicaudatus]
MCVRACSLQAAKERPSNKANLRCESLRRLDAVSLFFGMVPPGQQISPALNMQPDWNNTAEYTLLQPMQLDNQRTRKRRIVPTSQEIHNHLCLIANKAIDTQTSLRVQALINQEYRKTEQLRKAEQLNVQSDSDCSLSDGENYDYFVYASRACAPRRKKHKFSRPFKV